VLWFWQLVLGNRVARAFHRRFSMGSEEKSFASELEFELLAAGLPAYPHNILGRPYRFGCDFGSHRQILVGTVLAIKLSDEGALELHVSNPSFWGTSLISIMHNNGEWMAYLDIKPPERTEEEEEERDEMSEEEQACAIDQEIAAKFFRGEFVLL